MRLPELHPRWLAEDGRAHQGVELDCPRHGATERVQLWFENPGDHGPPAALERLHHVASDLVFDELTVLPAGPAPYRPLHIGHWFGWLVEGELTEALITGVAW